MAKTKATDRSSNQSTVPSWLEQINDEIVVKANLQYNSKELIDLANAVKEASEKAIHDASKIAIDAQEHLKKLAEEKAKYEIELAKELAKIESDRQLNLLKNPLRLPYFYEHNFLAKHSFPQPQ